MADKQIGSLPQITELNDEALFVCESQGEAKHFTGKQLKALARGIVSIERISGTGEAGSLDTYAFTYTDYTTSTFTVYNGKDAHRLNIWHISSSASSVAGELVALTSLYHISGTTPSETTVAEGDFVVCVEDGAVLQVDYVTTFGDAYVAGLTYPMLYLDGQEDGKKVLTVGTSSSSDYTCDGTDDQEQIQAAINALPATGGIIEIASGSYRISSAITVSKPNVTIRGKSPGGAKIYRAAETTSNYTGNPILYASSGARNLTLKNLVFDGAKATYAEEYNTTVLLAGQHIDVIECIFRNSGRGAMASALADVMFQRCVFNDNSVGLYLQGCDFFVENCTIEDNDVGVYSAATGRISGCVIRDNFAGISVYSASGSGENKILNNIIYRGSGLASDFPEEQHTVYVAASGNLIAGNVLGGKDVYSAYTNVIIGNTVTT